ncbi:MAG: caspase family protein [Acidobacteriota bacterium]
MNRHALIVGINRYSGFGPETQLFGAERDAEAMAAVLQERFGFPPETTRCLLGEQATQQAIRDALADLSRRVRRGDHVVFFFSGHGSQMTDREGDEGDGLDETLVPCDSGRERDQNRDLTDDELNHWAAGVLAKTPHLTLIFDCCHAATQHRPRWRKRRVPADRRPVDQLPPTPVPGWRDIETGPKPLVVAACKDQQLAYELPPTRQRHARGILSMHLTAALRSCRPGTTWRQLFVDIEEACLADCDEQHPQLSGDGLDAPIFGDARSSLHGLDPGRALLKLGERPDPFGLAIDLYRSPGGAWLPAPDGRFTAGDRMRVDLSHHHPRELFVYLFDLGLTGRVSLLFPDLDGHEALDPGKRLTVGARRGDRMTHRLPSNVPAGTGHLLLIASGARLSTARLLAGSVDLGHEGLALASAITRSYHLSRL